MAQLCHYYTRLRGRWWSSISYFRSLYRYFNLPNIPIRATIGSRTPSIHQSTETPSGLGWAKLVTSIAYSSLSLLHIQTVSCSKMNQLTLSKDRILVSTFPFPKICFNLWFLNWLRSRIWTRSSILFLCWFCLLQKIWLSQRTCPCLHSWPQPFYF